MTTNGAKNGKNDEPGRGSITPAERDALKQRASELGKRLDEVQARKVPRDGSGRARGNALGQAFKIVAEMMVGVVVGGGIGWVLDRQLSTRPLFLVLFLVLGFAAGVSNVVRTARKMQAESEPMQRSAPSVADRDDEDGDEAPGKAPVGKETVGKPGDR